MSLGLMTVDDGSWAKARINFARINSVLLGPEATPTFASIDLSGLTASRLVWTNASNVLASKDLVDLIAGTANEINVVTDGAGGVTIGLIDPLIASKGGTGLATITNHGLMVGSGTDAVTVLAEAMNGQLPIGSTGADPVLATITGTAGQIDVTNAAGSITLSLSTDISVGGGLVTGGDIIPDTDAVYDIGIYSLAPEYVLKDSYNTDDDSGVSCSYSNWYGQTFTTTSAYTVTRIKLKVYSAVAGTININLYATAAGKPTGVSLGTALANSTSFDTDPGSFYSFDLTVPVALENATQYAVVIEPVSDGGAACGFRRNTAGAYAVGTGVFSGDQGANWTVLAAQDFMFEIYGWSEEENDFRRFQDIYISGDISDGTNATSAAEIATAYAHSGLIAGNPHSVTPTELGLVIGTNVQAWDTQLDDIAALAVTDGNIIVGNGTNWIVESGDTARISLGVGSTDSPVWAGATITGTLDVSNGEILVEDNDAVAPEGKDDGYVGVAIIGGIARVYFAVNGTMYYIDGTIVVAAEIVTGNPIGLLLALTYNLE